MEKIDYKKQLKHLYKPSAKKVDSITIPKMNYLMVDGEGKPGNQSFQEAVEVLYGLSYTLKFMIKKGPSQIDYGVLPLEGLWWTDDMTKFSIDDKDSWKWTLMIMQPKHVTKKLVKDATTQIHEKKNPTALSRLRFDALNEGLVAQTMHLGPFSEEGPTVEKIHKYIADSNKTRTGKHHEIYLSDIRKAAPKNWKTIIRQPMS